MMKKTMLTKAELFPYILDSARAIPTILRCLLPFYDMRLLALLLTGITRFLRCDLVKQVKPQALQ